MFKVNENSESISFTFSSEMRLTDRVIKVCHEFIEQFNASVFSEFRLVLRELLINAVEHGNKKNIDLMVKCSVIHMGECEFMIMVEDEGDGFDHKKIDMKLPKDPRQTRRRGFALVNAFADLIQFNDTGNRVTVFINIPMITSFHIDNDSGRQVITPSGDITASVAEDFRTILVELADKGYREYLFDFAHVRDIDSVALSVLIVFAKMLGKKNTKSELEIINAEKGLRDLFHMTRMNKIFKVRSGGMGSEK
ncbi:MAG: STAS domain-containing protein [Desulfobacterales bacterium]|nr:STAS domain-containing protein [Desulfobacterales bacterium]